MRRSTLWGGDGLLDLPRVSLRSIASVAAASGRSQVLQTGRTAKDLRVTIDECKAYLAHSWVLHPDYRPERHPQHSSFEPVNIRLTFAHIKHSAGKDSHE